MVPLLSLWLPIVVAAVLVFLASSIVHMALTYHRSDYRQVPNEDDVRAALRQAGVAPGSYNFPWCKDMKELGSPEMRARFDEGPVGILHVMPSGPPRMGKHLGWWFVYLLLVSFFTAYVTGRTLVAGTDYLEVFRVAGTVSFMAYGLAQLADPIWKGGRWSVAAKNAVDGLLYALVTAGAFGWLWPG
jgi:hypothetical protein